MGMPKSGSSSIQQWLTTNRRLLSDRHAVTLVKWEIEGGTIRTLPFTKGRFHSGPAIRSLFHEAPSAALLETLMTQLAEFDRPDARVILSAESLSRMLTDRSAVFLRAIESLATSHDVSIVTYLRPQETTLEAAWCQWGFRTGLAPSRYVGRHANRLHYASMLDDTRKAVPTCHLVVRPFRRDLLYGRDVVKDFAKNVLDLDEAGMGSIPRPTNVGLPLDIANALRGAEGLWQDQHDNKVLNRLKLLASSLDLPPSDEALESRNVLRRYAQTRYETENLAMWQQLGVRLKWFVTPPESDYQGSGSLQELDELWQGGASEPVRRFLVAAVREAMTGPAH